MKKKTLVIGASPSPARFAYRAIHNLVRDGHEVIALGRRNGEVAGVRIIKEPPKDADIDTVTMYINPWNQAEYEDFLLQLKPRRIIFNPGSENDILASNLQENGVVVEYACTLVLLQTGNY